MSPIDLPPSRLGTKEHWDNVYSSELTNFEEIGDEGEVWFGEDSVEKMVDWALENVPPSTSNASPFILEVGAGNGNLLFALHDAGYLPDRMCGVDYSADAVKLAQTIAKSRRQGQEDDDGSDARDSAEAITFSAGMSPEGERCAVWDLVLDKGTCDAMALAGKDANGTSLADNYPSRVGRAVKPGGHFLITSCNFTEEELKDKFITPGTGLIHHSRIPFPSFSFGGKSGNVYSSVAFQKKI